MNVSVTGQTLEFMYSALLGVGLGVLYDLFRLLRVYLKSGKLLTGILDVIYWLVAIFALIAFVLTVSGGQMRWYVLVGAFCGGFIYMCTVSRLFFRALDIIIKLLVRLLHVVIKPLYFISGKAMKLARRADKGIRDCAKRRRDLRRERKKTQDE